MGRWKAVLLAAVILLLPALLAAETFEVTAPRANLRAGPGATFDIVGNLSRGEKFEVLGREGEWLKVLWLNREGWVHRSLGRVAGETRRDIGVSPSPAARPAAQLYGNSFAVVVGINNYRNPSIRLHYAVNDARSVKAALTKLGFPEGNIIYLIDGQATAPAIRTAFNTLIGRTAEQDRVVFFFAGHGVTLDRPGGGEMGYLLPVEGDPSNIVGTGIPMSEMKDLAGLLRAKHVLFAVDSCFSGLLAARSVPRPELRVDPAFLTRGRLRQVLTAGERDQQALEEGGHGLFTKRLLEALEGEADTSPRDGILTAMEIAAFVQGRVVAASQNRQTPFFGTMEGVGQFVFVLPGATLPPPPPAVARPEPATPPLPVERPAPPTPPTPPVTAALGRGDIYVASDPPGASIFVDGRDTGKKTPELVAGLAAGKRKLTVRKGEELGVSQDVEVKANELVNLTVRLERLQGELYAKVRPFGAEVLVGGQKLGSTPVKKKLPTGEHEVEVKKEGFYPLKQKVFVKFGETAELEASLRAIPTGTLVIESTPPGATIVIDGKEMGTTPRAVRLYVGEYGLEVRKEDYKSVTARVRVEEGRTGRASYNLETVFGTLVIESTPSGASILVDGREMGRTPGTLKLRGGPHQVELKKERHKDVSSSLLVEAGRTSRVAYVLPEVPFIGLLIESARSIQDAPWRASALSAIAEAQAKAGDKGAARETLAQALEAARSIQKAFDRASALSAIAGTQAKAGDFAQALEVARSIQHAPWRASALSAIAEAQAKAGDRGAARETLAQAVEVARSIQDAYYRARALSAIAGAQAKAGDKGAARETLAQALEVARSIQDAYSRAHALRDIAEAQAKAGDKEAAHRTLRQALEAAKSIQNANLRRYTLGAIAEAQAKAGDKGAARETLAQALEAARSIEDAFWRAFALSAIAQAQAKAGEFAQALEVARSIQSAYSRAFALGAIAGAQAEAGDKGAARETLAQALEVARSIQDAFRRAGALSAIAEAQAKAGEVAQALELARSIQEAFWRASALSAIAQAWAEAQKAARSR